MHNCQNIKEELLNLLFSESDALQTAHLETEVRFCAHCRAEFAEMRKTFGEYERFSALDVPVENYWRGYEMRLNEKLMSFQTLEPKKSIAANFYRKFLAAQIRIPVPIAAAFAVLFVGALFFAIRFPIETAQTIEVSAPPQIVPIEVEKIVVREKEIWRDRVAMQKIYVRQPESKIRNSAQTAFSARQKPEFQSAQAKIPTLNLAEFQPPPKVEPRIVAEVK